MQTHSPSPPPAAAPSTNVVRTAAGDPNAALGDLQAVTDAEILRRCALATDLDELHILATDPDTPEHVLVALAGTHDLALQSALLQREALPEAALVRLVEVDALVFHTLARPDCPVSLLEEAAESNEAELQRIVAAHPHTPIHVLDALAQRTADAEVEELLWERGVHDPDRLGTLAHAMDPEVRARVARTKATPVPVLARLSLDSDDEVRMAVAGRGDLPKAMAFALASDKAKDVARAARANPAVRRRWWLRLTLVALGLVGLAAAVVWLLP